MKQRQEDKQWDQLKQRAEQLKPGGADVIEEARASGKYSTDQVAQGLDAIAEQQALANDPAYQAQQAELAAMREGKFQQVGLPATALPPSGPVPAGAPLAQALPGELAGAAANDSALTSRAATTGRLGLLGEGALIGGAGVAGGSLLSLGALGGLDAFNRYSYLTSGPADSGRFMLGDRADGELVFGSGSSLQDDVGYRAYLLNGGDGSIHDWLSSSRPFDLGVPLSNPGLGIGRPIYEFESGRTGAWNGALNRQLESNAIYRERNHGYEYFTDRHGRLEEVTGNLVLDDGVRNGYQQRVAGGEYRLATDDGGHMIASIFGGPGERINLLPMDSNLNRGEWRAMEGKWAGALAGGREVNVRIQPMYPENSPSLRPDAFSVRYTIGKDRPVTRWFDNKPSEK